jgi:hypothetical protein
MLPGRADLTGLPNPDVRWFRFRLACPEQPSDAGQDDV